MNQQRRAASSPKSFLVIVASAAVLLSQVVTLSHAAPLAERWRVGARIQIVWPHDSLGAPATVQNAPLANVRVALGPAPGMPWQFGSGTNQNLFQPIACDFDGSPKLWIGLNNTPARPVATGIKRIATGLAALPGINPPPLISSSWPVWDFDNVDVSPATKGDTLFFFVTVDGPYRGQPDDFSTYSSVWAHGTDPRTYQPDAPVPTGIQDAAEVDTVIRIVWPHDELGDPSDAARGRLVNISAIVLAHGTSNSVPPEWDHQVVLAVNATNNNLSDVPDKENDIRGFSPTIGKKRVATEKGITFPVWDFNDIPLGRPERPFSLETTRLFWIRTLGVPSYPAIWGHGADARTNFPVQDVPREPQNCP